VEIFMKAGDDDEISPAFILNTSLNTKEKRKIS